MSSSEIVLYDIPCKKGIAWSLNPWKTRLILNFKKIDYRTEWVEFPDLGPKFKSLGIAPNSRDAPGYFTDYTCPAVKYPDGSYQMDSWPIAHELEKRYPNPPLHLDDPTAAQLRDDIFKMIGPLVPHSLPKLPALLHQSSAAHFTETREAMFGASLEEVAKNAPADSWKKAEEAAKETGNLLRKNGGPFFLGETVSYADFIVVSMLHSLKCVDEEFFQRYIGLDPAYPKLYEASKQWLERDY